MRWLISLIFVVALSAAAVAAEPKPADMVNNPPFANWSAFDVGTTVTRKEVVEIADGSKVEVTQTSKLVEKTKDAVVVETTFVGSGAGAAETSKTVTSFPAKVKRSDVDTPDGGNTSVTEGKEQVDLKGKKVDTEWVEATTKSGDLTVVQKVWTAKDVPGGIVRQTFERTYDGRRISASSLDIVAID